VSGVTRLPGHPVTRFSVTRFGSAVEIAFDDGAMNLLSSEALQELRHVLTGRPGDRVTIFKSGRPNIFAAGADMAEMQRFTPFDAYEFARLGQEAEKAGALLAEDPVLNAQLRTAAALTILQGGFRNNVIPSEGHATFNVRALPDEDMAAIVAQMQAAGAEPAVTFALEGQPKVAPPVSPADTALYAALEAAARSMAPGALVTPFMSTGATVGAALRRAGIPTYGILPFPLELSDELRMHGDEERVPLPALGWGTEYLYRTLAAATAP